MKPTVFLLGDSISLHYNPILIPATADRYEWVTKPGRAEALKDLDVPIDANGGSSAQVLAFLRDEDARGALRYDYLLFNCGLHDVAIDGGKTASRVDAGHYHKNLTEIVALAQSRGIKPIWVYTTPVVDELHNTRAGGGMRRHNTNVLLYNAIAKEVMKGAHVPMIDLYTFTAALGKNAYADHVHFTVPVREAQAAFLAEQLQTILSTY